MAGKKGTPQTEFIRNGADRIQQIFILLIATNWILLIGFWVQMFYLPRKISILLSLLLLTYNLILLRVGSIRARRFEDDALRFTITFASFLTAIASWVLYFF
ncbi:hypothetical protein [Thaumasiovibrio sp. DFM-14]|uniref:hypothetical protein n=1 Tax=Thaumasiovibrio sp. DFM-14 TaxID=3384792 RepID=UPI0039A318F4